MSQEPSPRPPATRAGRKAATARRLVEVAAELFARQGYAATGTEEVVRAAGVTRGALYHHFADKRELFRAVLDETQGEVAAAVADAVAGESDPWQALVIGSRAFLTAATDPARRRIMLIDGPAVLGWQEWREVDAKHSLRHLVAGLTELKAAGHLVDVPVTPLAWALSGAMNESALGVAASENVAAALADAVAVVDRLLAGLLREPR